VNDARKRENKMELKILLEQKKDALSMKSMITISFIKKLSKEKSLLKRSICNINQNKL